MRVLASFTNLRKPSECFMLSSSSNAAFLHVLFFFSSRRRHTRWPRDWSSDVCSSDLALMIPLSLLATFIGLRLRGIPANLLSLGAMDFGIIVDGAVIVVENVFRTLSERGQEGGTLNRETARSAILDATAQVGRPTLFSMLII